MLKKAAALLLMSVSLVSWVSCGKTSSYYLFASIPTSSQIVVFREDPNSGVLTVLPDSPFAAGTDVHSIVIHPSKKFLYAANTFSNDISLFAIDTSGAITEQGSRTATGTAPRFLVMDQTGSFLYSGNLASTDVWVFSIDSSTGTLSKLPATIQLGTPPLNMKLAPNGETLYVTVAGSPGIPGAIEVLGLSGGVSNNSFTLVPHVGANPDGLVINPSGTYLYVANSAPDNSISEFAINSNGSLTELSGSPMGETFASPIALLVDNSGKYLFVANEGSNNVAGYSIDSDGGLTILTNSPFGTNSQPSFIASDPGGNYLFVGNQASGAMIQSFNLATSSGTLTTVQSYAVGNAPTSIAVSAAP